ncbi:MAG: hypothetical protein KIT02_01385 [Devosia sp.]|uniref:hypothetical protein n=1 Tax=Devosia sp. TaxID=1871048 RepID=UPI0024C8A36E|nr:hypothetical protein [Devosia sp.]UYN99920.1 MAG: hypothetical protein KIT02_01385 [Devosia sp.]
MATLQPSADKVNRHEFCGYTMFLSDYQVSKINDICAGKTIYISYVSNNRPGPTLCQLDVGYN